MNTDEMKQVERRVMRYWYNDGIAELGSGGMFFLLGLYFGVMGYFEEGSLVSVILQVSMVLVFLGGVVGVRWLVNIMKSRLTYPRTGYVEYHAKNSGNRKRRLLVVVSTMVISAVSIVLVDYVRGLQTIVLITGVLIGVIFIALRGRSSGLKRFYGLGALAIFLGIILASSGLTQEFTLAIFYGFLGIAILVSGGLVLRSYLAENPSKSENGNE